MATFANTMSMKKGRKNKKQKSKTKVKKHRERPAFIQKIWNKIKKYITLEGTCDFPLLFLTTVIMIFGIVMVFSASYYYSINTEGTPYAYLFKQGVYATVGFILMMAASRIDTKLYAKFTWLILLVNILLLFALFTPLGTNVNGATRWIRFGPISIMPGELAKFTMIIFTARFFAQDMRRSKRFNDLLIVAAVMAFICVLIMKQPNLSTAITVAIITVGITFVAGLPWGYVVTMVVLFLGGVAGIAVFGKGYQRDRMMSFMDPFAQAQGDGFQVVQSLLALGTGGFSGVGIGRSVQKTLYLPEPHTDFILAIIGEELGFIGIAALMILFLLIIWRCFVICVNSKDRFGLLISGGVGIMIGVQVILNIAIITSSMPPTGVALPFITYGGNSLWIFMYLIGVVLNVSRINDVEKKKSEALNNI